MDSKSFGTAVKHYLGGCGSAAFNGGVSSLAGTLGIDTAAMTGLSTHAHVLTPHEMLSAFLGACFIHGLIWIKMHPLPEDWSTVFPTYSPDPSLATPLLEPTKPKNPTT